MSRIQDVGEPVKDGDAIYIAYEKKNFIVNKNGVMWAVRFMLVTPKSAI